MMFSMKQYLLTMAIFLGAALVAGIVVWYLYQDLRPAALEKKIDSEIVTSTPEQPSLPTSVEDTNIEASYTISAESLTDTQKSMLKSFGVTDSEFVITETMLTCAKTGVGEGRLGEILNGSAPTPFEAMKLLPCIKSN